MNNHFTERYTDSGNALVKPLCEDIAKIGHALNRLRIDGNPATITPQGIDLISQAGGSALPEATVLYKVLAVREYDDTGALVAIGSETYPTLATGHTLKWVEDWPRMGGTP